MAIKICGLTQPQDVKLAAEAGAQLAGFIFHEASPRLVSAAEVGTWPSFGLTRVGVFGSQEASDMVAFMIKARLHLAQIHGKPTRYTTVEHLACCSALMGPGHLIQVIWPENYSSLAELEEDLYKLAPFCSYFLLEAGSSGGGSGKSLAWKTLAKLKSPHPWFLAGGLGAHNAKQAAEQCRPNGLDFNSGLEIAKGVKCPEKIAALKDILPLTKPLNFPNQEIILND